MIMPKLLLFICLLPSISFAQSIKDKVYGSVVVDEVTSVYDGDTFRVNINAWPGIVGQRIPVRVLGIDTPEMRGKCKFEKNLAREAKKATVQSLRAAKKIELRGIKRGKYFRVLANVYVDGKSLANILINKKLAVKYSGGTKINWCK